MKFKRMTLAGEWTCERCGALSSPLQISPLHERALNCPTCGNPLVFLPELKPICAEAAAAFFKQLRKELFNVKD